MTAKTWGHTSQVLSPRERAVDSSPMRSTFVSVALAWATIVSCVIGVCWYLFPYWRPEAYLPSIERVAAPTIAAIDAYTARVGHPPSDLADLLPEYDAARAGTGYPRQPQFFYKSFSPAGTNPPTEWVLVLSTDLLAIDSDDIVFSSTGRSWVSRTGTLPSFAPPTPPSSTGSN